MAIKPQRLYGRDQSSEYQDPTDALREASQSLNTLVSNLLNKTKGATTSSIKQAEQLLNALIAGNEAAIKNYVETDKIAIEKIKELKAKIAKQEQAQLEAYAVSGAKKKELLETQTAHNIALARGRILEQEWEAERKKISRSELANIQALENIARQKSSLEDKRIQTEQLYTNRAEQLGIASESRIADLRLQLAQKQFDINLQYLNQEEIARLEVENKVFEAATQHARTVNEIYKLQTYKDELASAAVSASYDTILKQIQEEAIKLEAAKKEAAGFTRVVKTHEYVDKKTGRGVDLEPGQRTTKSGRIKDAAGNYVKENGKVKAVKKADKAKGEGVETEQVSAQEVLTAKLNLSTGALQSQTQALQNEISLIEAQTNSTDYLKAVTENATKALNKQSAQSEVNAATYRAEATDAKYLAQAVQTATSAQNEQADAANKAAVILHEQANSQEFLNSAVSSAIAALKQQASQSEQNANIYLKESQNIEYLTKTTEVATKAQREQATQAERDAAAIRQQAKDQNFLREAVNNATANLAKQNAETEKNAAINKALSKSEEYLNEKLKENLFATKERISALELETAILQKMANSTGDLLEQIEEDFARQANENAKDRLKIQKQDLIYSRKDLAQRDLALRGEAKANRERIAQQEALNDRLVDLGVDATSFMGQIARENLERKEAEDESGEYFKKNIFAAGLTFKERLEGLSKAFSYKDAEGKTHSLAGALAAKKEAQARLAGHENEKGAKKVRELAENGDTASLTKLDAYKARKAEAAAAQKAATEATITDAATRQLAEDAKRKQDQAQQNGTEANLSAEETSALKALMAEETAKANATAAQQRETNAKAEAMQALDLQPNEEAQLEVAEAQLEVQKATAESSASMKQGLANMTKALANIARSIDNLMDTIGATKGPIDTRLYGSRTNKQRMGSYFSQIQFDFAAAMVSPLVRLEDLNKNTIVAIEKGISKDVEQIGMLETMRERIATTFDTFDGNMRRLIRIQDENTTAARLGMEAALNELLNQMYETSEYLSDIASSVRGSLTEAEALMGAKEAVSFEYQVQEWLGSLYSVGVSQGGINSIAESLGKLAAGDIEGIVNGGAGNLLIMSANNANLSISDILADGLDASQTNDLLTQMVKYMETLVEEANGNKVVQQQLAKVFGLTASDLKAATNLTGTYNNQASLIEKLTKDLSGYDQMYSNLFTMANSMYDRISIGEMLNNMWANIQYGAAAGEASNPVLYLINKAADLLDNFAGGIPIPSISVMGNSVDTKLKVSDIMKAAAMVGGFTESLFSVIGGLFSGSDGGFTGQGLLRMVGLTGSGQKKTGTSTSSSGTGTVVNGSMDDMTSSATASNKEEQEKQKVSAAEESDEVDNKTLNQSILSIYNLLETVIIDGVLKVDVASLSYNPVEAATAGTSPFN